MDNWIDNNYDYSDDLYKENTQKNRQKFYDEEKKYIDETYIKKINNLKVRKWRVKIV